MLGSPCSTCCSRDYWIGCAMANWSGSFYCWNTCSRINSTTNIRTINSVSLENFLADDQWTTITTQGTNSTNPLQGQPPFYFPYVSDLNIGYGPKWGKTLIKFDPVYVTVEVTLNQGAVYGFGSTITGQTWESVVTYRKARAGFWESKYAAGVYKFTNADVFSFSTTANFQNLPVVQSEVGDFAIVQLQGDGITGQPVYSKNWDYPVRVQIQSETVSTASASFGTLTAYFAAGANAPYDFSSSSSICANNNTTSVVSVSASKGPTPGTTEPSYLWLGFYGTTSPSFKNCNDLLNVCAGCFITPVFWDAFSVGGSVTLTNAGQPALGNRPLWPYPGFRGFSQLSAYACTSGCSRDSVITVTKL